MKRKRDSNGKGRPALPGWLGRALEDFRRQPLLGAGVAVAAGFLLGGGLTARTLRVLRAGVGLAFQMAVVPALLSRVRDAITDETSRAHAGQ